MSKKFGKEIVRHTRYKKLDNFIISQMADFVNTVVILYAGGEGMDTYRELRAEISKQKVLRDMTNKDLATATGLSLSTINGFMCGNRYSKLAAEKICEVLNIPLKSTD